MPDHTRSFRGILSDPQNNEEVLHNTRLQQEFIFKMALERDNVDDPLSLSPSQPSLSSLDLDSLKTLSNKSICIYAPTSGNMPTTPNTYRPYRYIMEKWIGGNIHDKDISFRRFFAKFIQVPPLEPGSIDEILVLHRDLCAEFKRREEEFLEKEREDIKKVTQSSGDEPEPGEYDHRSNYKIERVFRSVMMILHPGNCNEPTAERLVYLLKTGIKDGIAISINFHGVRQIHTDSESSTPDITARTDIITTTFREAVNFIIRLNKSLECRFPVLMERSLSLIDPELKWIMQASACRGKFKGGKAVGSPTTWVKHNSSTIPHNCYDSYCHVSCREAFAKSYDRESTGRRTNGRAARPSDAPSRIVPFIDSH